MRSRTRSTVWHRGSALVLAAAIAMHGAAAGSAEPATTDPAAGLTLREAGEKARQLRSSGRYAEALPFQQRALALAERRFGRDDPRVGRVATALADSYWRADRLEEARPLAERAIAIARGEHGPDGLPVSPRLLLLGRIEAGLWRLDAAERSFQRALRIREAHLGANDPKLIGALSGLGLVHLNQGRNDEAESDLQRLLEIVDREPAAPTPGLADALVDFANAYVFHGRFAVAEVLYRRALALQEKALGQERPKIAKTLQALASLYIKQGRDTAAAALLGRAIDIRAAALGPDHFSVGVAAVLLAQVRAREGRYDEAVALGERAVAAIEPTLGSSAPRLAFALAKLANVYRDRGAFGEARPRYERALGIAEAALGPGHTRVASLIGAKAEFHRRAGEFDEAERLYLRALQIDGPRSNRPQRARLLGGLSLVYRTQGRLEEALQANRGATELIRRRVENSVSGHGSAELSEGAETELGFRRGVFVKHVRVLEQLGERDERRAAEAFETGQLAQTSGTARAVAAMAARFAGESSALGRRVRIFQDALARWRALDAALIELASRPLPSRDTAFEADQREELESLGRELSELGAAIDRDFPAYAAVARDRPISVSEVQRLLGPGEVLVSFLLGTEHAYAWAIRADRLMFRRLPGLDSASAARLVSSLRSALDPPEVRSIDDIPRFDLGLAHAAYRMLLAPLEPSLTGAHHLLIVADGALQSLPLSLLLTEPPGPATAGPSAYREAAWLARRYAVSVLPSASSLRFLRAVARVEPAVQPFVGFGDPLLDGGSGDRRALAMVARRGAVADVAAVRQLPRLPETAVELRAIARSLGAGPSSVFLAEAATETRARSLDLSVFRVLAFATHGLVGGDLERIGEPALVMTPPAVGTDRDDGLLTMSEVARLELNADWVILSACNTAGADGSPGADGLSGLARAFLYAGSRALLVSHWPVASDAALRLTTETFAALRREPDLLRSEALRRSMLALLGDVDRPQYAHPIFWAPFILVGAA